MPVHRRDVVVIRRVHARDRSPDRLAVLLEFERWFGGASPWHGTIFFFSSCVAMKSTGQPGARERKRVEPVERIVLFCRCKLPAQRERVMRRRRSDLGFAGGAPISMIFATRCAGMRRGDVHSAPKKVRLREQRIVLYGRPGDLFDDRRDVGVVAPHHGDEARHRRLPSRGASAGAVGPSVYTELKHFESGLQIRRASSTGGLAALAVRRQGRARS